MPLDTQGWVDAIYNNIKQVLNNEIAAGKRLDGFTIYEKIYLQPRDYKHPHIVISIMDFTRADISVTNVNYTLLLRLIVGNRGYTANLEEFRDMVLKVKDIIDEQRNGALNGTVDDIKVIRGRSLPPITEKQYMYYFYELEVRIDKEVKE